MAKRLVIDYGTDTLIDLDAPRQNLEQRFNLGGLVREGFKYSKKPPNLANPRKVTSSFHPHFNEWKYLHKPFDSPDDAISEPVYAKTKSEIDKIIKNLNQEAIERQVSGAKAQNLPLKTFRKNIDAWTTDWFKNNIDDYAVKESNQFFDDLQKAWAAELKANPTKYSSKGLTFKPSYEGLPNLNPIEKRIGEKITKVPEEAFSIYGNKLTNKAVIPTYLRKSFYRNKLQDPILAQKTIRFMNHYLKGATGINQFTKKAYDKLTAEIADPDVLHLLSAKDSGITGHAKNDLFEPIFKKTYKDYIKKTRKMSDNYQRQVKLIEDYLGPKFKGYIEKASKADRAALTKIFDVSELPDSLKYSQDHLFGLSEAARSIKSKTPDKKFVKQVLDNKLGMLRSKNAALGTEWYSFQRKNLANKIEQGIDPDVNLKKLNKLTNKAYNVDDAYQVFRGSVRPSPQFTGQTQQERLLSYLKELNKTTEGKIAIKNQMKTNKDLADVMKKIKTVGIKGVTKKAATSALAPLMLFNEALFGQKFKTGPWDIPLTISEDVKQWNELLGMDKQQFAEGGSVEPRVEYREGTRMSPAKPKEKTYEELLREIQMEYNIPTDEGYMVKDKLGRLGDIVDVRNYPYYGSKLGRGIMEAAEFSVRFPGAAGQYIHDVATGPGWKEQGLDFIENVSPGWGWSEKVGLDSLIDEQVGNMKKRGSSDAPVSLGGLLELGADVSMPLGYLYGAKKVGQFMKAVGKTPEQVSTLNKRIMDHLDASGQSRRDFITMAGTMGTFAALKAMGLDKVLKISPVTKATDGLIPMVKGTSKMPEWFPLFIQKIQPKLIYEGDGISSFKGTDDFLPGIEITRNGDDYTIMGDNAYGGQWNVSYEGPRWLEIEPGQKPTYFNGEFQVVDDAPRMVDPDGGVDWDMVTHDTIDDILGGNGRSMEEFAKGTKTEGLTKGEQQVDWAEGRFQSELDQARELEPEEWHGNYIDDRMPDDY